MKIKFEKDKLDIFWYYINERWAIYKKKTQGGEPPWTKDSILQTNRFTNIQRHLDRTSQIFLDIYNQHRNVSNKQMLMNCATFRYFGTSEFALALGWQDRWRPKHIKSLALKRLKEGELVFTTAYVITNSGIAKPKPVVVVEEFLTPLYHQAVDILDAYDKEKRWEHACKQMQQVMGFGGTGFMAKEVLLDMLMTPAMEDAVDKDTWTPCGPGGIKGINLLMGRPPKQALSQKAASEAIQALHAMHRAKLKADVPQLNMHDIQWNLCEIQKYLTAKELKNRPGKGRRVRRYKQRAEKVSLV